MDQQQYKATSSLAIAAMICGITSLVTIVVINILSIVVAIVAIVLSAVAMIEIKNNNKSGSGFAITGIICGSITLLLWCLFYILIVNLLRC